MLRQGGVGVNPTPDTYPPHWHSIFRETTDKGKPVWCKQLSTTPFSAPGFYQMVPLGNSPTFSSPTEGVVVEQDVKNVSLTSPVVSVDEHLDTVSDNSAELPGFDHPLSSFADRHATQSFIAVVKGGLEIRFAVLVFVTREPIFFFIAGLLDDSVRFLAHVLLKEPFEKLL